jgi:hypothetical protein
VFPFEQRIYSMLWKWLMVTITAACLAPAEVTGLLTMDLADYRAEVHPGPRAGCARCDAIESRLRGFHGQVLVPRGGDLLITRHWLYQARAFDALILADYSGKPDLGLQQLSLAPRRITVVHDIPTDAEQAARIHGSEFNLSALQSLRSLDNSAAGLFALATDVIDLKRPSARDCASTLRAILAGTGDDDLVTVIAHVKGGRLMFHDGSSISIFELHTSGRVFVVGCNTLRERRDFPRPGLELAFGRRLDYVEAASTVQAMLDQYANGGSHRDALLRVQNEPPVQTFPDNAEKKLRRYESPKNDAASAPREKSTTPRALMQAPAIGVVQNNVIGIGIATLRGEMASRESTPESNGVPQGRQIAMGGFSYE